MAAETSIAKAAPAELWRHPAPETTPMFLFLQYVNSKHGLDLVDYPALHTWSIDNIAAFWEDTWHFVRIKASQLFDEVSLHHLLRPKPKRRATCCENLDVQKDDSCKDDAVH